MIQNLINFIKGDVIGAEFEMSKTPSYNKKEIINPIWTDDTSQMFCIIEALIETEKSSNLLTDFKFCLKEKLLKWYYDGYLTPEGKAIGTGRTTREAMSDLRNNLKVENDKLSSGALMRCTPFLFTKNTDLLYTSINLTHKNELHFEYCKAYLNLYRSKKQHSIEIKNVEIPWIKNNAEDIVTFIYKNQNIIHTPEILNKVIATGGDTDTVLALIGALNEQEFLPDIKFNCPDNLLSIILKLHEYLKKNILKEIPCPNCTSEICKISSNLSYKCKNCKEEYTTTESDAIYLDEIKFI